MIRFFVILFFLSSFIFSAEIDPGDYFLYNGQKYQATYVTVGCYTNPYPVLAKSTDSNTFYLSTSYHSCKYHNPTLKILANEVEGTCEHMDTGDTGVCYRNECGDTRVIDSIDYRKNNITDSEVCEYDELGNDTGNIWVNSYDCVAPTGACYEEDNCTAPIGYSDFQLNGESSPQICNVEYLNGLLDPQTTTYYFTEAIWQDCSTKCYVKTVDIDCSSKEIFTPTLSEGETIYSTSLTIDQCIEYAVGLNLDARYEQYSDKHLGFACQESNFCIVKDRPHHCEGVDIPLPNVSASEMYFQVDDEAECSNYAQTHQVNVTYEHYDDRDSANNYCYDVNYCIVLGDIDDNNTTPSPNPGINDTDYDSTIPDITGSNDGTGVQSIDLNGTNDRLDVIDGHLKDGIETLRYGSDRNHNDLNRLSQDIMAGTDRLTSQLNGLSHSIGSVLDHLKNGETNTSGLGFDDSRIVQANNNTTAAINSIGSYLGADGNVTDLNVSFGEHAAIAQTVQDSIDSMNSAISDMNTSKDDLQAMIEEEATDSLDQFEDRSKSMLSDLLDRIFSNSFTPFQPMIDVGSNSSNFGTIYFPVNIDAINFHKDVYVTQSQLLGDKSDPAIAKFYDIIKKLSMFLAVFFGFLYLIRGVSDV